MEDGNLFTPKIYLSVQTLIVGVGWQKAMPSTRVERVTFPLQVERATTTPTRHYDRSRLSTNLITGFRGRGVWIRIDFKRGSANCRSRTWVRRNGAD